MPDPVDRSRRSGLRDKLPELLIEAGSVAFAVLLALFVDQWRENRSNIQLAERAEESIMAEVRNNLERLEAQALARDSLVAYTFIHNKLRSIWSHFSDTFGVAIASS